MVNRIIRDDPSKSDMHNRQGITLSLMWKAMKDFDMYDDLLTTNSSYADGKTQVATIPDRTVVRHS